MMPDTVLQKSSDLVDAARLVRDGKLSPVDLVEGCLGRIERHDDSFGAFSEVFRAEARTVAEARAKEARSGMPLGPLHGIPVAVKDLLDIEGRVTAAGSKSRANRAAATHTASVVRRLAGAGAVIVGKASLVEFAFGGWGTNQGCGTPWNPWDLSVKRSPGGSSSGSAVAVAAGMALGALGTDTGGSVRIPSAFCGLTGLKVTEGRVSNDGMSFVSRTLDTIGPMGWSARDAALMLDVIHGPDACDPKTFLAMPEEFLDGSGETPSGIRIACPDLADIGQTDDAILPAFEAGLKALESSGCRIGKLAGKLDFAAEQEALGVIIASEAYAESGDDAKSDTLGDRASRARVLRGEQIPAHRYARALAERRTRQLGFQRRFEEFDIIALPTLPITARPVDSLDENDLSPSRLTRFASYFGLCAIAVPCGFDGNGLPISMQLVAAPFRERLLLAVARAFQGRTDWHRARPPQFD